MPASPILKSLDFNGVDIGSFDRFSDNYEARIPNTVSQTTVTGEAAILRLDGGDLPGGRRCQH